MLRIALLLGLSLSLLACASSPPSRGATRTVVRANSAPAFYFSSEHAAVVRAYYADSSPTRGNGRGKRGLPPGIAKNLARGKPLPPGIARQYLPDELLVRLPAVPTGLEYVVIAGKLLLVEAATRVVREVLIEAMFG